MKLTDTTLPSIFIDHVLSNAEAIRLTGGAHGKIDRDSEEQEDMPVVSNDIPNDYPSQNSRLGRGR